MCLAVPAEVLAVNPAGDTATVAVGGVRRQVSLLLLEDVAAGDFVLIHVGFAIGRISPQEAARTLALFAEAGTAPDAAP